MTSEKIKDILQKLGYSLSDFGSHWRTSALYRGGNNPSSVQIYKDSGVWVDYVKGDGYMSLRSLVEATLQTNDKKEISELMKGYDFDTPTKETTARPYPKTEMEKTYPDSILMKLLPHYSFYNKKGICDDVLGFFKGGLATEGAMYQRFVFPVYNQSGLIHGFSGRDMSTVSSNRPKWKHVGKKSTWVYPYYIPEGTSTNCVQDQISQKKEIILVESIGDLLNLHQHGIKNVVVTFGTSISSAIICFLLSLQVDSVVISLNNDSLKEKNRGEIGALKTYLKLLDYFNKGAVSIKLPLANDFGDMSSEDFDKWKTSLSIPFNQSDHDSLHHKIKRLVKAKDIPSNLYKKKYFS
tara:strand:+ start:3838 stop:4893 length:1056 start_codon:yes stop_codon:yes gene_type:complete